MAKNIKMELFCDNFQNYKRYGIPKAQLVIADIPYNVGANAYGSNQMWYKGGDNKNGESKFAKKAFFNSDGRFKIAEYIFDEQFDADPKQTIRRQQSDLYDLADSTLYYIEKERERLGMEALNS